MSSVVTKLDSISMQFMIAAAELGAPVSEQARLIAPF
jgi:hypothetical protein